MRFIKFTLKGAKGDFYQYAVRTGDIDEILQLEENITVVYLSKKYKKKDRLLFVHETFEEVLEKVNHR